MDDRLIKLKEPGLQSRLFQFQGGEEKSPYEDNFSTSLHNMLDAYPTSRKRLHHVFYEPFLRDIQKGSVDKIGPSQRSLNVSN
jgi:hypothetical protein